MTRRLLAMAAAGIGLAAGCAQAPMKELELVGERVAAANEAGAALYAPELLASSEAGLAEAQRLVRSEAAHREALRVASEASLAAEDAQVEAARARADVLRHLDRLRRELDSLLEIAASRGAEESEELRGLRERCTQVDAIAANGDLLGALDEATRLKPELLAFEQRFR